MSKIMNKINRGDMIEGTLNTLFGAAIILLSSSAIWSVIGGCLILSGLLICTAGLFASHKRG